MINRRATHPIEAGLRIALLCLCAASLLFIFDFHDLRIWVVDQWVWWGLQFRVFNSSTPLFYLLLPTAICGGFVYGVMLVYPAPTRPARAVVIVLLTVLHTVYLAFRLLATLNLSTVWTTLFSVAFFLAEAVFYVKTLSTNFQMFWPSNRSPEAGRFSEAVISGKYLPSVDIFVPTYSESVSILRRTILGCQALRYPDKQIYLLDDQRRPEMCSLAKELGCHYRDRPDNTHAKAGNMNAALPTSRGELIAVFDADFIPTQDFLERTVGFFADRDIGLVQTPQNFYSFDAVSRNLGLPGIITEEQQVFFRAAQPGRDTLGAMLCHGTSFIVRRTAIEGTGGFPGETLAEDWATSIKLQSAGFRCVYLNELLSAGAAAEFMSEFVTQRLRWARGTLQCFFSSTNPVTVPGLNLVQRLVHLCGPLHYFAFLPRTFCLLLPLLYFGFGIVPVDTPVEELMAFFLPYCLCQMLTVSWLSGGHRSAFWSEVYETMLCFPMSLTVVDTLLRPFGKPFKVSKKGHTSDKLMLNSVVGAPLICLFALYVPTLIYAIANASWYPSRGIFAVAIGWTVYSMVLLWLSLQAAFDLPQKSNAIRFKHQLSGTIRREGSVLAVSVTEISESDVIVRGESEILDGSRSYLSIPEWNLYEIPVSMCQRWPDGSNLLKFDGLGVAQQRALVTLLYCRPGQWSYRGVPESITFWHFLEAPFRMYPLAESD